MAPHMLDDLDRPRLDWPEPLIIDLIEDAYGEANSETATAARLHARFLRTLIAGETQRSGPLRLDLIACCAARNISSDAIAAADHAVFQELSAIIQSRFRHSPRLRLHFVAQLHEALGALTRRDAPAEKPARTQARPVATRAPAWPRLPLGRSLAFSG